MLTDTLIYSIHTHVLVQLRPCVLRASALGSPLLLLTVYVVHAFAQFRRSQVRERKSHDDNGSCKIVGEV